MACSKRHPHVSWRSSTTKSKEKKDCIVELSHNRCCHSPRTEMEYHVNVYTRSKRGGYQTEKHGDKHGERRRKKGRTKTGRGTGSANYLRFPATGANWIPRWIELCIVQRSGILALFNGASNGRPPSDPPLCQPFRAPLFSERRTAGRVIRTRLPLRMHTGSAILFAFRETFFFSLSSLFAAFLLDR